MSEAFPAWQRFDPSISPTPDIEGFASDGIVAFVCSESAHAEGWGPEVARAAALGVAALGRSATLYDLSLDRPKLTALLGSDVGDGAALAGEAAVSEGITDLVRYGASLARITRPAGPLHLVPAGTVDTNPAEVLRDATLLTAVKEALERTGGSAFLYVDAEAAGAVELVARVGTAVWIAHETEAPPTWLLDDGVSIAAAIGRASAGARDTARAESEPIEVTPPEPEPIAERIPDTAAIEPVGDFVDDAPFESFASAAPDRGGIGDGGSVVGDFEEVEIDLDEGIVRPVPEPERVSEPAVTASEPETEVPAPEEVASPSMENSGKTDVEVVGIEIEPQWPDFTKPLVVAEPGEIDPLDAGRRERPLEPASFDFGVEVDPAVVLNDGLDSTMDQDEPLVDLDAEPETQSRDPWEGTGTFAPEGPSAGTQPPAPVSGSGDPPPGSAPRPPAPKEPLPWETPQVDPAREAPAREARAPVADVTRTVARPRQPRGFLYVLFALFLLTIAVLAWAGFIEIPGIDWFQGDTP